MCPRGSCTACDRDAPTWHPRSKCRGWPSGSALLLPPGAHILSLLADLLAVGSLERGFVGAGRVAEIAALGHFSVNRLPGDREGHVGEIRSPYLLRRGSADGDRLIRRIGDGIFGVERRHAVRVPRRRRLRPV